MGSSQPASASSSTSPASSSSIRLGLRLAVTEHGRASLDGFEFVIAGAAGAVLKVLRLTGLDVTLPLAPDVASVLGDASTNGRRPRDP